jgi:thiol-disulfide isomerase/thioredoxin
MKVLKIGAKWCLGCISMKPRWAEVEKENSWLKTQYIDYDDSPDVIKKYNIDQKLPVFIFLDKNSKEIERLQGVISKEEILKKINEHKDR